MNSDNSKNKEKNIKILDAEKKSSEWKIDPKGYFLIDPRPEEKSNGNKGTIYAHYYTKNRTYNLSIKGVNAEEIYYTILRKGLVSNLMHASYLGSELQKAEQFINIKNSKTECSKTIKKYVQDKELEF